MVTWNLNQAWGIVGSLSSAIFATKGMCRVFGVIATLQADVGHGGQTVKMSCSAIDKIGHFLQNISTLSLNKPGDSLMQ